MKTQTEIKEDILENGYTWGRFVQFHEIGNHLIVEHKAMKFDGVSPVTPRQYEDESSFSVEKYNESFNSLDRAIIASICRSKGDRHSDILIAKGLCII